MNRLPEFCIRLGSLNVDNLNPKFFENFSEKPFSDELEVHTDSENESDCESDCELPELEHIPSFLTL